MCIRLANESKHKKAFPPYVSNMAVAEKILAPFVPKGKRNSVLLNAVEARKKGCYNSRVVELDRNQVKRWKLNLMALFYEGSFFMDP